MKMPRSHAFRFICTMTVSFIYTFLVKLFLILKFLKPSSSVLLTVLWCLFYCNSYFMLFRVEVLCRFSYNCFYDVNCINVSFSGFITSVREERERERSITRTFEFSCFLFVLRIGCVILLWHSLSLPYNLSVMILHLRSAIFRAPLILRTRFPDIVSCYKRYDTISASCTLSHRVT